MAEPPAPAAKGRDDDGFTTAAVLFAFYVLCIGAAAYLYWHGTGKLPWQ